MKTKTTKKKVRSFTYNGAVKSVHIKTGNKWKELIKRKEWIPTELGFALTPTHHGK